MLAEIQQSSDVTYRIYDFDRVDQSGHQRELHIKEALEAIDYRYYDAYKTSYPREKNIVTNLVSCPYFTSNRMHLDVSLNRDYGKLDSFIIYIILEGNALLKSNQDAREITIKKGDVIMLPASLKNVSIHPDPEIKMLETYISDLTPD